MLIDHRCPTVWTFFWNVNARTGLLLESSLGFLFLFPLHSYDLVELQQLKENVITEMEDNVAG
jgi:hypothetical protein